MRIDLKYFLAVPDNRAMIFASNHITEEDAKRGVEAAQSVLNAVGLHPLPASLRMSS